MFCMLPVSLTGSYTEDEPNLPWWNNIILQKINIVSGEWNVENFKKLFMTLQRKSSTLTFQDCTKHNFLWGTNKDDYCCCWFLQPLSVYMVVSEGQKIDANHNWVLRGLRRSYALPTGFHADIIIRRSSGLFLILSITVANWSTPWPLYSACMLMYLAPKWRHWNPYTGPRSPSSRSCKPKQKLHWDVNHEQ